MPDIPLLFIVLTIDCRIAEREGLPISSTTNLAGKEYEIVIGSTLFVNTWYLWVSKDPPFNNDPNYMYLSNPCKDVISSVS